MKKYYSLEPEVAGELGEKTEMDTKVHPPIVHKLHYIISGWLGDDLIESFPCYIITEKLRKKLEEYNFTGYQLDYATITTTDEFNELYPNRKIPELYWLKIIGKAGHDDFGISKENTLIVSELVMSILKTVQIDNCDIEEI